MSEWAVRERVDGRMNENGNEEMNELGIEGIIEGTKK